MVKRASVSWVVWLIILDVFPLAFHVCFCCTLFEGSPPSPTTI